MSRLFQVLVTVPLVIIAFLTGIAAVYGGWPRGVMFGGVSVACVFVLFSMWRIPSLLSRNALPLRVEGTAEPTFRLVRRDLGHFGEVWQLMLGGRRFALIRPDGTEATALARKWAVLAFRVPGFWNGSLLRIVKENWYPPADEGWLGSAVMSSEIGTDYYLFSAPKELVRELGRYLDQTPAERGPASAVGPLRIKARRAFIGGLAGSAFGGFFFANGLEIRDRRRRAPVPIGRPRAGAGRDYGGLLIWGVVTLSGLAGIAQGVSLSWKARKAVANGKKSATDPS